MITLPLAFWSPGPGEMLVIGLFALLLYGGDLPRVAKSWGRTLSEFRRGLSGIQDEINDAIYAEPDVTPPKLEYHPEFHGEEPTSSDANASPDTDSPEAGSPDAEQAEDSQGSRQELSAVAASEASDKSPDEQIIPADRVVIEGSAANSPAAPDKAADAVASDETHR